MSQPSQRAARIAEAAARLDALQARLFTLDAEAERFRDFHVLDRLEVWGLKNSWSYRIGRIALAPLWLAESIKAWLRRGAPPPLDVEYSLIWSSSSSGPPPQLPKFGEEEPDAPENADLLLRHIAWTAEEMSHRAETLAIRLGEARRLEKAAKDEIARLKNGPYYRLGLKLVAPASLLKKALKKSDAGKVATAPPPGAPGTVQAEREACEARCGELEAIRDSLKRKPLFSILMPVYDTDPAILGETLDSVLGQIYGNWQLCVADDCSPREDTQETLARYAETHPDRIKTVRLEKNGGIGIATNRAAELAEGEFVCLLDHDDILSPDALLEVARAVNVAWERGCGHELDLIYSDQDRATMDGELIEPYYKPDFSPELLLTGNYITHFSTIRASLFRELGGFREGFDGSQDYDLILRVTEKAREIVHVPKVLYHWKMIPGSTAASDKAKGGPWRESSKKALRSMVERRGWDAQVENAEIPSHYRVRFATNPEDKVAIIVPTKDRLDLVKPLLKSIEAKTTHKNYEVLVVCNNCEEEETFEFLRAEEKRTGGRVRHVACDGPFNFSRINNFAAAQTDAPYLLFLNNDTEALSEGWLTAMLEHAQRSEIGAVGAKLMYPSGTVQHAGVILGLHGIAGHSHVNFPRDSPGYFGHARLVKNYSAVTAACLMTRREVFESVGGFNEALAVAFNDVDWCLRVRDAGYRIVFTPYAELTHKESESRGDDLSPAHERRFQSEIAYMLDRWGEALFNDPFHSPNLTLWKLDFSARTPEDDARTYAFKARYRHAAAGLVETRRHPLGGTFAERALHVFPRWNSTFHVNGRAIPAAASVHEDRDPRLAALDEKFPLAGKRVLDLRPGEGAGDKQLADLGAQSVGVESDPENYLKRALAKSAFDLPARLLLGRPGEIAAKLAREEGARFDLCLAGDALGRAEKPLDLLDALATMAGRLAAWGCEAAPGDESSWSPIKDAQGREYRGRHRLSGHEAPLLGPSVFLLAKDSLLKALEDRGFEVSGVAEEGGPGGRFVSFEAARPAANEENGSFQQPVDNLADASKPASKTVEKLPETSRGQNLAEGAESFQQAVDNSGEGAKAPVDNSRNDSPPQASMARGRYKEVWTALSDTEERAKKHVLAFVDERRYKVAGERTLQTLKETVGVGPEDAVLEIGCGIGRVGQALAPVAKEWIGCDVSPNMVRETRRRLAEFPNARAVEVSGSDLAPIADASVDVVYCTVVFMHLEEWDRYGYVLEAKRVLRPGGRLYVDNFSIATEVGWQVFENHRLAFAPGERPPHVSVSSTSEELKVYLERAGFEGVQVRIRDEYAQAWGVKPA